MKGNPIKWYWNMNLIAGATGFLGNYILLELGNIDSQNIAISRRAVPNLPNNTRQLVIDFDNFIICEGSLKRCNLI